MKRKMIIYSRLCITLLILLTGCIESLPVHAAVAKLTIQSSEDDIKVGDSFYIMLTLTADEEMKGFDGYISYDQSYMKFITGGSVSHGNDDEIHINDTKRDKGTTKIKYAIKCQARRAGVCEIGIKEPYKVYRMEDDAPMSLGSSSLNLKISSPQRKKKKNRNDVPQQEDEDSFQVPDTPQQEDEDAFQEPDTSQMETDPDIEEPDSLMGKNENTLQTPPISDKIGKESTSSLGRTFPPEASDNSSGTGFDRKTLIAIICMSVSGLVMIITMISGIWHREEWQDSGKEKTDRQEPPFEEEFYPAESSESKLGELNVLTQMVQEDDEEIDLEEVQKRLEAKRRWLKKGGF